MSQLNVLVHDNFSNDCVDTAMIKETAVKTLGPFMFQIKWNNEPCWYVITRKDEKVNLWFYVGPIDYGDVTLFQISIWKLAICFRYVR